MCLNVSCFNCPHPDCINGRTKQTPEQRREAQSIWHRKKYAENEEFREKRKQQALLWRKENPEKARGYVREYLKRQKEKK